MNTAGRQSHSLQTLPTVGAVLRRMGRELALVSDSARLDAQTLLAHVLGRPRSWLLAHPEAPLSAPQNAELEAKRAQLLQGTPLPYLLGEWEFFGRKFSLTPAVLIPRPETELLVGYALAWLAAHPGRRLAADVGTGSGCIAVCLAAEVADLEVVASDLSHAALKVAASNAGLHQVQRRLHMVQADLLPPVARRFDLVCANLPYIPSERLRGLAVFEREPLAALDGGPDGLQVLRRLMANARASLAGGGLLLAEIDAEQAAAVRKLAGRLFPRARIEVHRDLAGLDRMLVVEAA